jgi:hypothetical protein
MTEGKEMRLNLYRLVDGSREELIEALLTRVKNSRAPHYRDVHVDQLRARCRDLVHEFRDSLHSARKPFSTYLREITEERISGGYLLHEIQEVLSVFEEELWKLCHREVIDREDLYRALAAVSGIIGSAKDQLARLYLEQEEKAEQTLVQLQDHLEQLLKGTETVVVSAD